jgi:hypothetical protein
MLKWNVALPQPRGFGEADTLPKGASGNKGDVCNIDLFKDGRKSTGCGETIEKKNHMTEGIGDL